jgi:hypothetical protein
MKPETTHLNGGALSEGIFPGNTGNLNFIVFHCTVYDSGRRCIIGVGYFCNREFFYCNHNTGAPLTTSSPIDYINDDFGTDNPGCANFV